MSVEYWYIIEWDKVYGFGYCFIQGKVKIYNIDNFKFKKLILYRYLCEKNNI